LKAAIAAAPFIHAKLAVTAVIADGDMAERLARAIARSAEVINARPATVVDARPVAGPADPAPTPLKAPMAGLRRM
jgi:hypothetical protein